ncbi:unnamed protein product [Protopolystoma xenopodis]|uniref:Uncharacterized protein n=1 Tax=Protopolystoma xenopodis TaxID=117903 RepID=A0A3S5B1J4_9PLAT|nr:unnamed protein product [Protopolystoma xenopodis]
MDTQSSWTTKLSFCPSPTPTPTPTRLSKRPPTQLPPTVYPLHHFADETNPPRPSLFHPSCSSHPDPPSSVAARQLEVVTTTKLTCNDLQFARNQLLQSGPFGTDLSKMPFSPFDCLLVCPSVHLSVCVYAYFSIRLSGYLFINVVRLLPACMWACFEVSTTLCSQGCIRFFINFSTARPVSASSRQSVNVQLLSPELWINVLLANM